jgi:formylmethanofuran dehydrogenase subunit A
VSLLNTGTIYTGDGVTYRIKVTVPSGWSNFDIELEEAEG